MQKPHLESSIRFESNNQQYICQGDWDINHFIQLSSALAKLPTPKLNEIKINGQDILTMDSAGAWQLIAFKNKLKKKNEKVSFIHFSKQHESLLAIIEKKVESEKGMSIPRPNRLKNLASIGLYTLEQINEFITFLSFTGKLSLEFLRIIGNPKHIRWGSLINNIYRNGYLALPIIALLSFMIGVVITYQMGLQLRNYGANVFIVDLLGLGILREFGPLLTAIMLAGRTGSSYTAQLGIMKINQEIDALDTMGVTPSELLLLPRIVGLVIALPLLTIWADIFGVFGGMIMANNMLGITWNDFLHRFPHVIKLRHLLIGLGKAPVFALIISSIGCFQGMQVAGSADSVGRNTTRSVVLAIFFIIVADALFSVIFSKLKL